MIYFRSVTPLPHSLRWWPSIVVFSQCWCGDSFDLYGPFPENLCSFPCQGDAQQECGGLFALSVYSTA